MVVRYWDRKMQGWRYGRLVKEGRKYDHLMVAGRNVKVVRATINW